ncbi:lactonase family protein [Ramlibacter sp. PS4R-6]|uniref:lactonase family protein n=1 Tax=Ramlibacter sp. PS4R-6 TaxID=3133438 RepID=UPI0030ABD671
MQGCATSSTAAAYVSNADSKEITVLKLDRAKGTVQVTQTLEVGGTVMPMALSPDKRFLYAALRSEPFSVASFSIDPATGALKRIGTAPLPDSMANIMTDRTGRWLFAASYGGNKISVSPIGSDGLAGGAVAVIPTGKNAHAAIIDASNRNLLVTNLGSDQVLVFKFDAASGKLAPAEPAAFATRAGAGPRHLVLHPNGKHAYLLHELDATVDLLGFDADRGNLKLLKTWPTLPQGSTVKPWASDIHVTPDGKYLYTAERNTHTIAMWKIDAANGELTLVGHQPTEKQPRGFQVDSTGTWLLAVGQTSHQMTAYKIDPATGKLSQAAQLPMGKNPNWVEIVDLK